MKIGQPVSEPSARVGNKQYRQLYEAIRDANGLWVPIQCENKKEFDRTYNALRQNGHFEVRRRELTLYAKVKIVAHVIGTESRRAAAVEGAEGQAVASSVALCAPERIS